MKRGELFWILVRTECIPSWLEFTGQSGNTICPWVERNQVLEGWWGCNEVALGLLNSGRGMWRLVLMALRSGLLRLLRKSIDSFPLEFLCLIYGLEQLHCPNSLACQGKLASPLSYGRDHWERHPLMLSCSSHCLPLKYGTLLHSLLRCGILDGQILECAASRPAETVWKIWEKVWEKPENEKWQMTDLLAHFSVTQASALPVRWEMTWANFALSGTSGPVIQNEVHTMFKKIDSFQNFPKISPV